MSRKIGVLKGFASVSMSSSSGGSSEEASRDDDDGDGDGKKNKQMAGTATMIAVLQRFVFGVIVCSVDMQVRPLTWDCLNRLARESA